MTNATSKIQTTTTALRICLQDFEEKKERLITNGGIAEYQAARRAARMILDQFESDDPSRRDELYQLLDERVERARPVITEQSIREELSNLATNELYGATSNVITTLKNDKRLNDEARQRLIQVAKEYFPPLNTEQIDRMLAKAREGHRRNTAMEIIKILMNDKRIDGMRNQLLDHLEMRIAHIIGDIEARNFIEEQMLPLRPTLVSEVRQLAARPVEPEGFQPSEDALADRVELIRAQMAEAEIDVDEDGLVLEATRQLTSEHNRQQRNAA